MEGEGERALKKSKLLSGKKWAHGRIDGRYDSFVAMTVGCGGNACLGVVPTPLQEESRVAPGKRIYDN